MIFFLWKSGLLQAMFFLCTIAAPASGCWMPLRSSSPEVTRFTFSVNETGELLAHDSKWDNSPILILKPQKKHWASPKFIHEEFLMVAEERRIKLFSENSERVSLCKTIANEIFETQRRSAAKSLVGPCYIAENLDRIFFPIDDAYLVFEGVQSGQGELREKIYVAWPSDIPLPRQIIRLALGEYLRHFYEKDPRLGR